MRQAGERRIGTAGWSIARASASAFPEQGGALERYAAILPCAEINSSFHRAHRPDTWQRWAASVPDDFRFSAKLPKAITHSKRLVDCDALLDTALGEMAAMGEKLAILVVQLPPSLAFNSEQADAFFAALRARWPRGIACEPRHPSWFAAEADALLARHGAARVAADPVLADGAGRPGGWDGLAYYRLHGSPNRYRSSYDDGRIEHLAEEIGAASGKPVWCIFDNTASSAATGDALKLAEILGAKGVLTS